MLITVEPRESAVRKHEPAFKLPDAHVAAKLDAVDQQLLERLRTQTAECVYNPVFEDPDAERGLMTSPPVDHVTPASSDDSGVGMFVGTDGQQLTIDAERHLFLRFNYARWRVLQIVQDCKRQRLSDEQARQLLRWERIVVDARDELVRNNVPLVLAMVKRTKIGGVDYADLISEGNLALMRAVDKFDCARGYKFSTYACRAILKAFARVATRTARYRGHFPTEFDPTLEKSDKLERDRNRVEQDCIGELRDMLESRETPLSEVEQKVIRARFAVGEDVEEAQTLEQVGLMIGVTKERVRQIQNKALVKLRSMLESGALAV